MSYWNWNWDCLLLKHLFVSISPNPCCGLRHLLGAHVNSYKGRVCGDSVCAGKVYMCACVCMRACLGKCMCVCVCADVLCMKVCALACIHVCIEGIAYTAWLMWKSCTEPGFYILFIISWHNVGNRHQCSFQASACKPWPGLVTEREVLEF